MVQRSSMVIRERPHPLVVTSDPQLLDDLVRLAAAGGSAVRVVTDAVAARPVWRAAPFVLVGADTASECIRVGLGARSAVVIVARSVAEALTWQTVEGLRAEHVAVLPAAEAWLVDRFAEQVDGTDRGQVVGVLGAHGEAGASVLATALAVTARRSGLETLLIDADPCGGGTDLALGWERLAGMRWPELVDARGRLSPPGLVGALPAAGSLAMLSFDQSAVDSVPADAMAAALDTGRRGRDLVIVDLPRRFDDASLMALTAADRAYLVMHADTRSLAEAKRIAAVAASHCPGLTLVVRGPVAGGGAEATAIAAALDIPLVGVIGPDATFGQALLDDPPAANGQGPLAELCRDLLNGVRPRQLRVGGR